MYAKHALYILLLSIFATGCAKHQIPTAKKNSSMLLSKTAESNMDNDNTDGMIKKLKISNDKEKLEMLDRVGKRLASGLIAMNFEFILVENNSVNASCLPNGKIIVNTGVFNVAKTDAQLATIISHEMAHVISRHGSARINRNKTLNIVEGVGTIIVGLLNPFAIVPFILVYESSAKKTS